MDTENSLQCRNAAASYGRCKELWACLSGKFSRWTCIPSLWRLVLGDSGRCVRKVRAEQQR